MIYLDNNTFQQEIFIPRSSVKNDASPEYATKNELENAIENEVIRADEKYAAKTDLLPYATTGWVESQDFATKEWTDEQIQSAITSETGRTEETYQKKSEMGIYSTTNEVENMIDGAVSGKMDTSAMSAYTKTEDFATINGSAITEGGNIIIEGGGSDYSAGSNINIDENNVISVTGISVPTKVSELVNDEGYITTADTQNFVTSGDVQTQINDSISGKADSSAVTAQINEVKQEIEAKIPSKVSSLENDLNFVNSGDVKTQVESYNYINSGQAQTQIDNSISGKLNTDIFTTYTANTQIELNNKQDASGMTEYATTAFTENTYAKIGDIPTKTSDLTNDSGFITNAALSGYATEQYVDNSVSGKVDNSALTQYYTSAQTDTAISNAVSGKLDTSAITAYSTTEEVENMITAATYGLASEEWVNNQGFLKEHQDISGKLDTSDFTAYTANTQTEIDNKQDASAMTAYATTAFTESTYLKEHQSLSAYSTTEQMNQAIGSATAATTGWVESQGFLTEHQSLSAYTPTSGFSTINGSAITSGDNLVIEETPYSGGTNIEISDHIISVTGITVPTKLSELTNDEGFVNSGEVETQITDKGYITGYTESDPVFQASAASGITSQDISNWNNKLDSSALTPYYTSAQTDTAINNATSGKQDTLVSGVNIKTINNESLLGSGNIVIQGGGGGSSYTAGNNIDITNDVISVTGLATINGSAITEGGNIVIQGGSGGGSNIIELTQAEYDALTAYTEDAIYVITDSQAINMDNYVTTGALGSYYTSAETDTAISNAVSGKTDKVSVTASSGGYKFPTWNNQGCITGTSATAYQASQSINGSSRYLYSTSSSSLPTIYAPTSAGSAGQPLLSNGGGAPVWGSYKFQFISQSEYDALATKDSTTIYFIVN